MINDPLNKALFPGEGGIERVLGGSSQLVSV